MKEATKIKVKRIRMRLVKLLKIQLIHLYLYYISCSYSYDCNIYYFKKSIENGLLGFSNNYFFFQDFFFNFSV